MTTPQAILSNLEYNTRRLVLLLEGRHNDDDDSREDDIREVLRKVEIGITSCCKRMDLIEDKMNLIIKLLGKDGK